MQTQVSTDDFSVENLLHLMDIYRAEWEHRETILWRQNFRFFYAVLIVDLLPNLSGYFNIHLPDKLPLTIYPVAGIALSLIFLYVALGAAYRLECINSTYQKIMERLPDDLQRIKVSDSHRRLGKLFHIPMGKTLSVFMFTALFALSFVSIIFI